ncbi:MAG: peptidoglycan DD-metalloendopeptidase family protein [Anaerolineae bacterium]
MWRKAILSLLVCLTLLLALAGDVLASVEPPPESGEALVYVVEPGDTLDSIARRYGSNPVTLARVNGLSDPRQIYAGQRLRLAWAPRGVDMRAWTEHRFGLGESFSLTARRSGLDWETVAVANQLLNPGALLLGQSLLLPPERSPVSLDIASREDTWLTLALREGSSTWEMVALNPQPIYTDAPVLVPGEGPQVFLPHPIASLTLTPQPVTRGQTAVLALETTAPASCKISYLDRVESCLKQDESHLYALVSLSPMLEPDTYDVELSLWSDGSEVTLTLPLVVTAGRFGFERINVSAGRQYLFDPALLAGESDQVNLVANLRSEQRFWMLPFDYPVYASVSSYFGSRRSYGGSYNSYHSGVDFRAATGTPVRVPAAGTVLLAEPLTVRGNAIIVDHGWGVATGYWHLSRIDVEVGQSVTQGQVIGRVGNTGLSTGAHLHWQLWVDGTPVDPLQWVRPFYAFPDPASSSVPEVE